MAVNDVDVFSNDDIAEDREEREDGRECRFAVDDEEGDVVDLEAVREVANSSSSFVCMGNHNHFVTSVDEFLKTIRSSGDVVEV
jgi:hypothetical protein